MCTRVILDVRACPLQCLCVPVLMDRCACASMCLCVSVCRGQGRVCESDAATETRFRHFRRGGGRKLANLTSFRDFLPLPPPLLPLCAPWSPLTYSLTPSSSTYFCLLVVLLLAGFLFYSTWGFQSSHLLPLFLLRLLSSD